MNIGRYDIFLDFSRERRKFWGSVKIHVDGNADEIRLDSEELAIERLFVNGKVSGFELDPVKKLLLSRTTVATGDEVFIEFTGSVSGSLMGLYSVSAPTGEFLTTQFEPTGARMLFPCVDVPSAKSIFSIKVRVRKNLSVISNMKPLHIQPEGNNEVWEFADTPRMSTYLLFLGIGKFSERVRRSGDVTISLISPDREVRSTDFPLETAEKSLQFFEEYFGIDYMLPHLQLVSIPEFTAGAMENWGAIAFRETFLLTSGRESLRTRKSIAEGIAHEIAHHWFGNLVTMKWWNDVWLKESFATFMSLKAVDSYYPEFNVWEDFLLSSTAGALAADSLESSRPIDTRVDTPDEIAQVFDAISYGKGASVLRMIESYVGKENFRDGVRNFLSRFSYSSASGADLWKCLDDASGKQVSQIVEGWIKNKGYPMLHVAGNGNALDLRQEKFCLSAKAADHTLWHIPFTYTRKDRSETFLMGGENETLDGVDLISFSPGRTAFIRVDWDLATFKEKVRNTGRLDATDIWCLASDAFALAQSEHISVGEYLERVSTFFSTASYLTGQAIAHDLWSLLLLGRDSDLLKRYIKEFCEAQLSVFGKTKRQAEDPNVNAHRDSVFQKMSFVDSEFAGKHGDRFLEFDSIDPDHRNSVCVAFALSRNDFDSMLEAYRSRKSEDERVTILYAMGWLSGEENYRKTKKLILSDEVKLQNITGLIVMSSMNSRMAPYVENDFEEIVERSRRIFYMSGYDSALMEDIIPYLGLRNPDSFVERVRKINGPDIERGVNKGLEMLTVNRKLVLQLQG